MSGASRDDVSWFCSGVADRGEMEDRLDRYLRSGSVRPAWCFMATTPDGRILARHWWWASPGSPRPAGVDLVSVEERESAAVLLRHARDQLEISDAVCELTASAERATGASAKRGAWGDVLTTTGFVFDVARVRVERAPERVPADRGRLVFRPARGLTDELLVRLFEAVADDSLDHWMVTRRASCGREGEARERLGAARSFGSDPEWFTVGYKHDGVPVGYVVPALVDEVAVVAEIGVAREHRGHGYGLDLLLFATRLLAATGAPRIVADTDQGNSAMRATFALAGFTEREYRETYRWQRT